MSKQDSLDQIRAYILEKNVCSDLAKTAKQLVFGDGNPDADVVFIGEAPGKNEDEQGKPFVGASGKLLSEFLESIGLDRQDVYITNIVKYRPPNNRDPSDKEKEHFLPFLYAQLRTIEPKVVVTLGRHSTNCFLPDLQISKIHGQSHEVTVEAKQPVKLSIFPMFHPAVALYDRKRRSELQDDFDKLKTILNK
jgi:uracil-DNA glycosylase family 4